MNYELTQSKIDWLTDKICNLLNYRYSGDQIYEVLSKIKDEQNIKQYKYLVSLTYNSNSQMLEQEIKQLCSQINK